MAAEGPAFIGAVAGAADAGLMRDFAITMAVAGGALVLFRQLRLPPVLGYLLAGVLIGPFTPGIRLVEDTETIRRLADLGLVLLLFGIGLEFGWQRIRQIGAWVILIATIEITFMFALGYEAAILLGWSGTEGVFLGAALSISSSAILVKMLQDTGRLQQLQGRLIVGILAVEDFAAVILLTVLSGVATTGTANLEAIGLLAAKLAIFAVAALVFGTLLAPRIIQFVQRFKSEETLLIASLALCFGLALAAQQLALSAAAGAFLIGMVLGDTEHSKAIVRIMAPVRDMFAALFFVSIGMLIDPAAAARFIVPALIISAVFIVGKILANTAGALLAGHDGRTSLSVGMGTPQVGEFSLAMAKVGVEHGAVGTFLYPVITVATAVTALIYPFIFRSSDATAEFFERRSPRLLKQYGQQLVVGLATLRRVFQLRSPRARRIQRSGRLILLNLGIVIVLIASGTGVLRFTSPLSNLVHLRESLLGLIIGGAVLALCVPSAVAIWRSLRTLTDGITEYVLPSLGSSPDVWRGRNLNVVLRDSILILLLAIPAIWSLPLVSQLLSLGSLSTPLPILLLIALIAGLAWTAFQIHRVLEATFSRTFLGTDNPNSAEDLDATGPEPDTHRRSKVSADPASAEDPDPDHVGPKDQSLP
jgi:CPA2 family monovalent cation:H+ antiporter-2